MDIASLSKTLTMPRRPQPRSAVTPAKSPQDRRRRRRQRDGKPAYEDDVTVTLSGRAPSEKAESA